MNKGLFITLDGGPGAGERYQITHPVAHVNGVLRGSFYATVQDSTIVTCTGGPGVGDGEMLRAIIEYKEEVCSVIFKILCHHSSLTEMETITDQSWLGRPRFLAEGVVHRYNPSSHEHEEWTKVKHVPSACAVAYFEGCWQNVIRWYPAPDVAASTGSSKGKTEASDEWTTLIDLTSLRAVPKTVRPISEQLPTESRRLWESVTSRLQRKEFGEATRAKQVIEQRQRDEAAERKRRGVECVTGFLFFFFFLSND